MDDGLIVNTTSNLKLYLLHDQKSHRLCRTVLSMLHQKNCVLNVALLSQEMMRNLNQKFRQKNTATDVLSFGQIKWQKLPSLRSKGQMIQSEKPFFDNLKPLNDYSSKTVRKKKSPDSLPRLRESRNGLYTRKILGDLAICPHVAVRNARHLGHGLDREFGFLLVHGILHLCGYDHVRQRDEEKMLEVQRKIMDEISILPQPLWRGCLRRVSK